MSDTKNKVERVSYTFLKESFPETSNTSKLQITTEGKYSVTGRKGALFIANKISNLMKTDDLTITDCTANNGSDSTTFATIFKKVNAIELDKTNFSALSNNVSVLGLTNISLYNANTLDILEKLTQDVLYLDAPWGGKNYVDEKNKRLYIGDLEISQFFLKYRNSAKLHVYKVPKNYDFNYFVSVVGTVDFSTYSFVDVNKYNPLRFRIIIISTELT